MTKPEPYRDEGYVPLMLADYCDTSMVARTPGETIYDVSRPGALLSRGCRQKVARLHLKKIGVKLTELRRDQADYIGVSVEGPFKSEHYRY